MIYKQSAEGVFHSLKWILLFSLIAAILILTGDKRLSVGVMVIYVVLVAPQLYLIIQYENAMNYKSFQIDHINKVFIINVKEKLIEKSFTELQTVEYHKAVPPSDYSSLVLKLCGHLYYYKFEFKDGSTYYLTSLLDSELKFEEKNVFYDYFIETERKFATIK